VVPPVGTDQAVDDAIALGIKEVWMQPGSMSETAAKSKRCKNKNYRSRLFCGRA
jgi:predicted CoA-binding protein